MNTATISGNDFLDILFNGRNKDYGAYDLRRKYDRRVRNAIIGTASVTLAIIGGYALSNRLDVPEAVIRKPAAPVVFQTLQPLEAKPTPPPPPVLSSSTPPPARPSAKYLPPVIARDEDVRPEDVPPRMSEFENKSVGVTTTAGDETGIDADLLPDLGSGGPLITPKERDDPDKKWVIVEIMPSFPGGEDGLARYLNNSIRYPHIAAENGIEGLVVVQFVVDYEGNIKDVKVLSTPKGGGLEQEATRVIKAMPKWKPGRQNGRNVSVLYSIPVNFRLSN
ncbi:energy transducer TonB [uncultured Chitinophaga sp.]|jgi:TonB family C-terminal domain|uniref:energy transducer TonB n=1 Tax=uncultured Chitinophaga sp. TaxID=339340 RepID=UPI00260DAF56|nr:energy transducer TonB [uncultured Chitinophaga sp.]